MQFTAIDFETANAARTSACAVGIALIENGRVVNRIHQLLRPDPPVFHPFNVAIHGITAADVAQAPSFAEYWPTLFKHIAGPLVAHNASFDMSVLRGLLSEAGLAFPETDYFCTRVIARLTWRELPSYALSHLAGQLRIAFRHHDAAEDAYACACVALAACGLHGVSTLYDLQQACGLRAGMIFANGYRPCKGPRKHARALR